MDFDLSGGRSNDSAENASLQTAAVAVTLGSVAVGSVLFFLCGVIGIGNLFVVLAVCVVRRLRQPAHLLTISLAIADISVAVFVAPAAALVEAFGGEWPFGALLCKAFIFSDVTLCSASILNLCAISVDRYACIRHPFGYQQWRGKRLMCSMIAVVWAVSVVVSLPPLFLNTLSGGKCHYPEEVAYQLFAIGGSFYLPLVVMSVLYGTILATAKRIAREETKLQCVRQMHLDMARAVATFRGKSNSICRAAFQLQTAGCSLFNLRRRSVSPAIAVDERAVVAARNGSQSASSTAPVTPASPAKHRANLKADSSQITAALAKLSVAIALTTQVPSKGSASCDRAAPVSMNGGGGAQPLLLSHSTQCLGGGGVRQSQDSGVVSFCGSADDKCARSTRFQSGASGSLPIVNEQRVLRPSSAGRPSDAPGGCAFLSTRSPLNSLLATIPQRDEPSDSLPSNVTSPSPISPNFISNAQSPPISPGPPDSDGINFNFNFSKRGSTQSNSAAAVAGRAIVTIDEASLGLPVAGFLPDGPSDMSALSRRLSSIGASSQGSFPVAGGSISAQSLPPRHRIRIGPENKAIITLGTCRCTVQ